MLTMQQQPSVIESDLDLRELPVESQVSQTPITVASEGKPSAALLENPLLNDKFLNVEEFKTLMSRALSHEETIIKERREDLSAEHENPLVGNSDQIPLERFVFRAEEIGISEEAIRRTIAGVAGVIKLQNELELQKTQLGLPEDASVERLLHEKYLAAQCEKLKIEIPLALERKLSGFSRELELENSEGKSLAIFLACHQNCVERDYVFQAATTRQSKKLGLFKVEKPDRSISIEKIISPSVNELLTFAREHGLVPVIYKDWYKYDNLLPDSSNYIKLTRLEESKIDCNYESDPNDKKHLICFKLPS